MSSASSPFALLDLPYEIIELILTKLPPLDIVKCRPISKFFLDLIDKSAELQLRIELAVDGLLLNRRGTLSASALLAQVLGRRRSWEDLEPRNAWTVPCLNTGAVNFEICDGIWSHCIQMNSSNTFRGVHYEELVSPSDHPERWIFDSQHLDIDASDFSFFVADDAQVLMEMSQDGSYRRIHFRTLSTNLPHPVAAAPFLDIQKEDCVIWEHCSTIGNGEYLLLMFTEWDNLRGCQNGGAVIISWKQAKIIMPYRNVSDVAFIDPDNAVLMTNNVPQGTLPALELYSLSQRQSICILNLPFTGPVPFATFLTHPVSHWASQCPSKRAAMFIPDPDLDILGAVFYLRPSNPTAGVEYLIVISLKRLLQAAEDAKIRNSPLFPQEMEDEDEAEESKTENQEFGENSDPSREDGQEASDLSNSTANAKTKVKVPPVPTVEYQDWGLNAVRWFPSDQIVHAGFRSTFSSRLVTLERRVDANHQIVGSSIAVLDFNDRPIRRTRTTSAIGVLPQVRQVVLDGRRELRDVLDRPPVPSVLPFRASVSHGTTEYLSVFMEQNGLIGRTENTYDFFSFLPNLNPGLNKEDLTKFKLFNKVDKPPEISLLVDLEVEEEEPESDPLGDGLLEEFWDGVTNTRDQSPSPSPEELNDLDMLISQDNDVV